MKRFILIILAFFVASTAVLAQKSDKSKTETVKFAVSMSCGKCKAAIEQNIPFEKGVKDVVVDLPEKTVTVTFDPSKTSADQLIKAFEKMKYTATIVDSTPRK